MENARLYYSVHEKAEQLQRLKEHSESIVASISVGVIVVDLDEKIESWNPAMKDLLGRTKEGVLGKSVSDVLPLSLIGEIRSQRGQDLSGREVLKLYKCRLNIGDKPKVADVTVTPLMGKDKQVTGQIIILDDKTCLLYTSDAADE